MLFSITPRPVLQSAMEIVLDAILGSAGAVLRELAVDGRSPMISLSSVRSGLGL
jgi:hypothetical protein